MLKPTNQLSADCFKPKMELFIARAKHHLFALSLLFFCAAQGLLLQCLFAESLLAQGKVHFYNQDVVANLKNNNDWRWSKLERDLYLSTKVSGLGRIKLEFDSYRVVDAEPKQVKLFKGLLTSQSPERDSKQVVAAAMYEENGQQVLKITFQQRLSANRPDYSFYELHVSQGQLTRVKRVPQLMLEGRFCAAELKSHLSHSGSSAAPAIPNTASAFVPRVMEISTEADAEWFAAFGESSNAEIVSMLNAAEVIYSRDIKITFKLNKQVVRKNPDTQPYNSSDAEALLETFRREGGLGAADVYHLFSGKSFLGSTIGIAYVGVVCVAPAFSYGVSQNFSSAVNYITFAHEVGHNLDALHDTSQPASLMFPSTSIEVIGFSDKSKQQIDSFVGSNGQCLALASSSPTPSPSSTPAPTPNPDNPTPSPTASATPNPGGGGGGGIDGGMFPIAELNASLSRQGNFRSQALFSGALNSECQGMIVMSPKPNFSKRFILSKIDGADSEHEISLKIGIKAKGAGKQKKAFAYVRSEYSCPNSFSQISDMRKIEISKIRTKKKAVSVAKWISQVKKLVASQVKG